MASSKQAADNTGKSPVRTEMADKTAKKFGGLTVNTRQTISEDKGDLIETQEVEDKGQVVARYVKKDGKVIESAATPDAQSTGLHEKASKAAGVDKDGVVFTTPSMNAAEAAVEVTGDEDEDKPADPMGEKAKLDEKTKENKKSGKVSEGKKPDKSMSKMASEKTGEKDKDGDRDLSKELAKSHDKITHISQANADKDAELERKRQSASNMLKLLETIKKMTNGPRPSYDPKEAMASPQGQKLKALLAQPKAPMAAGPEQDPVPTTPTLAKGMPAQPWHDVAAHDHDQKIEALLEEKLKRTFPGPTKLTKADDDPSEPMRRMRVEHSAQHKLNEYQPPAPKAPGKERPLPKSPNYKLLTPMESNAKTAKNEGVEGSEGQPHFSAILHLAPATLAGVGNVCEGATSGCRDACLNTAGRGGMFKAGEDTNTIQDARVRKTRYLAQNPGKFMDDLIHDVTQVQRHAEANKAKPVVRLNGTSDIAWEDLKLPHFQGKNIFEAFPGIQFYDYTKRPDRVMRNKHANYHLTFSRSDKNENVAKRLLAAGHNVAAVFGGKNLPTQWHGFPVISGDEHDLRFLDPRGGHVVGLKAKGDAKADKSGFVVWDHEGNTEGAQAKEGVTTKHARMIEAAKKMGKSDNPLRKAKQEADLSPRGKRLVREERRIANTPDPIAKPRPELPGSKGKQPLKKEAPPVVKPQPKLPQNPPQPVDKPKVTAKPGPALDYSKINKPTAKPAANTIDYSKFPKPPPEEPNWKKKMNAGKTEAAKPRGVVAKPQEQKPRAVIRKADEVSKDLKKDDPMTAGINAGVAGSTLRTGGPTVAPGAAAGMAAAFGKADPLKKDDKAHAPGSPEDSAHDVVEEGSSLKGELKQLGTPEKMSQMLTHLRSLKGGQGLRSPANEAAGKDPVAKSEPEERENTPGNRKRAKDEYEQDMKAAAREELEKATPAPAAPPAPKPTIPSALTKPKKPKEPTVKVSAKAAQPAAPLQLSEKKWPVPGKVPPKMPERPAQPMEKHVPGVSDEKYDSCVKQVKAKGTGNAYAICTASLKKCCDIMRGNGGAKPLAKGDVVDLKGKKVPKKEVAHMASDQAQRHGIGSGNFLKQNAPKPSVVGSEPKAPQQETKPAAPKRQTPSDRLHALDRELKAKPASLDQKRAQAKLEADVHAEANPMTGAPYHPDDPAGHAHAERTARIRGSLDKINKLMAAGKAAHAAKAASEAGPVAEVKELKPKAAAPKKEGYDFDAAAKQNADKKAKQAEAIKNQDVKGIIARNPRGHGN